MGVGAQGLHASRRLAVSDVSVGMELLPPLLHLLNLKANDAGPFQWLRQAGSPHVHTYVVGEMFGYAGRACVFTLLISRRPSPTLPKICNWFTDTLAFNPVKVHAILGLNLPLPLGGHPLHLLKQLPAHRCLLRRPTRPSPTINQQHDPC